VISIELLKNGNSIHQEIAKAIRKIELCGDNSSIKMFCEKQSFQVVTTNYDKLFEHLSGEADCQSLTPGLPIPRSLARIKVFHVHGSVDAPENMVVTADDYFRFLNAESYFSRKLSTILHENTVVILGYSLGDTNLKAILSDYKGFSRNHVIGSNIFLVSRSAVGRPIKDYYSNCYGIRVIDEMDVKEFFDRIETELPAAKKCAESSVKNIKKVVGGSHHFTEKYLKLENSFYEIVSSISAAGYSLENKGVVKMFGSIIEAKSTLSSQTGAWEQYIHLANWLIYVATILEIKNTSIEKTFLKAVKKSMEGMSKDMILGYSWQAYKSWSSKWDGITPTNRHLIRDYIVKDSVWPDAVSVVNRG
jgi:SIR2-like domain